jgi:hypothetical protein
MDLSYERYSPFSQIEVTPVFRLPRGGIHDPAVLVLDEATIVHLIPLQKAACEDTTEQ